MTAMVLWTAIVAQAASGEAIRWDRALFWTALGAVGLVALYLAFRLWEAPTQLAVEAQATKKLAFLRYMTASAGLMLGEKIKEPALEKWLRDAASWSDELWAEGPKVLTMDELERLATIWYLSGPSFGHALDDAHNAKLYELREQHKVLRAILHENLKSGTASDSRDEDPNGSGFAE